MKRPNPILYCILGFLLKIYAFFKRQRIKRYVKIKGPAIILSNHTSFHDFVYTTVAAYPKRVSYLAAAKMFYDPLLGFFLRLARAIPKSLYQTDPIATIKAFKILKQGGIVGIFPEGQISPIGVTLEYNPSIVKLIKKANVAVYSITHKGAYLVNPPWTGKSFPGKVETEVKQIVSREDIMNLSDADIIGLINDHLMFNTHEYNAEKKMKTGLNDISNLESVIYHCPTCGADTLESSKTALICPNCHSEFVYDRYGQLGGYRLDLLYREQERLIAEKFVNNPDYKMSSAVILEGYSQKRVKKIGEGELLIDKTGYHYQGTANSEIVSYDFSPKNIVSLPSDLGRNIQIYENYLLYQFAFSDRRIPTKFVIAGEYIHKAFSKEEAPTFSQK